MLALNRSDEGLTLETRSYMHNDLFLICLFLYLVLTNYIYKKQVFVNKMSLIKEEKGTFRITNFVPCTTIVVMVNEK